MSKSVRVGIISGTIWGNRGAEAMLITAIGEVRKRIPDAKCTIFSYYPHKDAQLLNDSSISVVSLKPIELALRDIPLALLCRITAFFGISVPLRFLSKSIQENKKLDLMLDIGGITFCDGREIFLLFNVCTLLPSLLLNVPLVKLSQALGPFKSRINIFFASLFLPRCKQIFTRGEITQENIKQLNLESLKALRADDIAFSFQEDYSLSNENEERIIKTKQELDIAKSAGKKIVSIIPSSLVDTKSEHYISHLVAIIKKLHQLQFHIILVPNATREGHETSRNNDLVPIAKIATALDKKNIPFTAVQYDINTASIRSLLQYSQLTISSRFHGMVGALALGIPVIVIGWSHKYKEVLDQFELTELALDMNDSANLDQRLENITNKLDSYTQKVEKNLNKVVASSQIQFDYIAKLLT